MARFINADDMGVLSETCGVINGLNLYAYCGNNPVMNVDPNGRLFKKIANWFNNNIVQPVGSAVTSAANWVNDTVIQPIGSAITTAVDFVDTNIIQPVVNAVTSTADWVADTIIPAACESVKWAITGAVTLVKTSIAFVKRMKKAYDVLAPVFEAYALYKFEDFWNTTISGLKSPMGVIMLFALNVASYYYTPLWFVVLPFDGMLLVDTIMSNPSAPKWLRETIEIMRRRPYKVT